MMTAEVTLLFPIGERRVIYAHLRSFTWSLSFGLAVRLRQGKAELAAEQVGYGSVKDQALVVLSPRCEWLEAVQIVDKMKAESGTTVYLERGE